MPSTRCQDDIKIVYTPLHGTGNIPVRRVLKEIGFTHVYVVPEQELPDGDFPTVSYPNPEAAEAFALGLGMAKKLDADLVLATDQIRPSWCLCKRQQIRRIYPVDR